MKSKYLYSVSVASALLILTACNGGAEAGTAGASTSPATISNSGNSTSSGPSAPAPTSSQRTYTTDALLFVGSGTWGTEVANLQNVLTSNGATFKEVTSAQLDAMSVDELATYGVLIFPGGSGGTEAGSLTSQTHANLRAAVRERGVNYIGFCAGAFVAQAPEPAPGQDVSYGFGIVAGPELNYYYLENQGTDIAMTLATLPDGSTKDLLWYGGPVTPNVAGGVIAKYPNGDPMITEVKSGNGLVIMSAVHPTANQATLSALGMSSSDGLHQDYAWTLIKAAIHGQPLPAF